MGNILPQTNKYNENKLEFNESLEISNNELSSSLLTETEYTQELIKLEERISKIETVTFSNLKVISEDIHLLFEMINKKP